MDELQDSNWLDSELDDISFDVLDELDAPQVEQEDILSRINSMLSSLTNQTKVDPLKRMEGAVSVDTFAEYTEEIVLDPKQMFPSTAPPDNCILFSNISQEVLLTAVEGIVQYQYKSNEHSHMEVTLSLQNPDLPDEYIASDFSIPLTMSLIVLMLELKKLTTTDIHVKLGDDLYEITDQKFLSKILLLSA